MSSVTLHPSDLTDAEWQQVKALLPASKARGRPREWPLRLILDGIFYLVRSGCSWRMLPTNPYPAYCSGLLPPSATRRHLGAHPSLHTRKVAAKQ